MADDAPTPKQRTLLWLGTVLATASGLAFMGVAASVALSGTGAEIPAGENVIEGMIAQGRAIPSPAGDDFLYGEVRIARPGASAAVDHSWSTPAGDARVVVTTEDGPARMELPPISEWRGLVPVDQREVMHLDGLPIVSDAEEVDARMEPPYLIVVRALREGDALIARVEDEAALEVHIGSRAELQAELDGREAMRWPIVGLMAVMGLAMLGVGFAAFRRARAR